MSAENPPLHGDLVDLHQSWWQMAAIQLMGFTSLPVLAASVFIFQQTNFLSTLLTLVVGNILLWVFCYGMISMGHEGRLSLMDISSKYMGSIGAHSVAILLLITTISWFVVEVSLASEALTRLVPVHFNGEINRFFQFGVFLGIISTLMGMEGIVAIRWVALISFPILFLAFIGTLVFSTPHPFLLLDGGVTLSYLPVYLAFGLSVSADLPTFFRHSRSLRSSIQALTAIQISNLIIGIAGLFIGSIFIPWMGLSSTENFSSMPPLLAFSFATFIIFSTIGSCLCTIYSASVGWELLAPALAGIKEYVILGLGSTIVFVLIANIFSLEWLDAMTSTLLGNLTIVFSLAYLQRLLSNKKPTFLFRSHYFLAWVISSLINFFQLLYQWNDKTTPLLTSLVMIPLFLILSTLFRGRR